MKAWRVKELGESTFQYYAMRRCANLEDEYIKPIFLPPPASSEYGRISMFKPMTEKRKSKLDKQLTKKQEKANKAG